MKASKEERCTFVLNELTHSCSVDYERRIENLMKVRRTKLSSEEFSKSEMTGEDLSVLSEETVLATCYELDVTPEWMLTLFVIDRATAMFPPALDD